MFAFLYSFYFSHAMLSNFRWVFVIVLLLETLGLWKLCEIAMWLLNK